MVEGTRIKRHCPVSVQVIARLDRAICRNCKIPLPSSGDDDRPFELSPRRRRSPPADHAREGGHLFEFDERFPTVRERCVKLTVGWVGTHLTLVWSVDCDEQRV